MAENTKKTEELLLEKLTSEKMTFAAAESCTGGLICQRLTAIPGSSSAVMGGVVSYAVSVKENVLGVKRETLERDGVVSEQCAREMACGVRELTGADIAVSVTGVAGPGGGSAKTPVGTVCFGAAFRGVCKTYTKHFPQNLGREGIRDAAAEFAMRLALDALENASSEK